MSLLDRLRNVFVDQLDEPVSGDVGPPVVEAVFRLMQIDAQYMVPEDQ